MFDVPSRFNMPIPRIRAQAQVIRTTLHASIDDDAAGAVELKRRILIFDENGFATVRRQQITRFAQKVRHPAWLAIMKFDQENVSRTPLPVERDKCDRAVIRPFGTNAAMALVLKVGLLCLQCTENTEWLQCNQVILRIISRLVIIVRRVNHSELFVRRDRATRDEIVLCIFFRQASRGISFGFCFLLLRSGCWPTG